MRYPFRRLARQTLFASTISILVYSANSAWANQCAQLFFVPADRITNPNRLVIHTYLDGEYREGLELLGQELRALPPSRREALSVAIASHIRGAPKLPRYFVPQKLGPKRSVIRLLSVMNSWAENLIREAPSDARLAFENHLQGVLGIMRQADPELGHYSPLVVRDVIQLVAEEYRAANIVHDVRLAGSFVNGYAHLRTSDLDVIEPLPFGALRGLPPSPATSPLTARMNRPEFIARLRQVFERHRIAEPMLGLRAENTLSHFAARDGESPAAHALRISEFVGQVAPIQFVIRRRDLRVVVELEIHRHDESNGHFTQSFPLD